MGTIGGRTKDTRERGIEGSSGNSNGVRGSLAII